MILDKKTDEKSIGMSKSCEKTRNSSLSHRAALQIEPEVNWKGNLIQIKMA